MAVMEPFRRFVLMKKSHLLALINDQTATHQFAPEHHNYPNISYYLQQSQQNNGVLLGFLGGRCWSMN